MKKWVLPAGLSDAHLRWHGRSEERIDHQFMQALPQHLLLMNETCGTQILFLQGFNVPIEPTGKRLQHEAAPNCMQRCTP